MHIKRTEIQKRLPLPRKGTKYLVVASHAKDNGVALLIVLRDILKIANNRAEARKILLAGDVKVNNKIRKSEKFPMQFFDVIELEKAKKVYRLEIVNKKFALNEISEKEKDEKIVKIVGRKILGKDKVQMNLEDGRNIITKEKFNVRDSVIVNTKDEKIVKILELKPGAKVEIILGKHAGESGVLKEIKNLRRGKDYIIKLKDKEIGVPLKTLIVIG